MMKYNWNQSEKAECWESYYLRHCCRGQLYMADVMPGIADYAEKQYQKKPDEAVHILSAIEVPCVYIHAKENVHENGIYLCAASLEQTERAVSYIGDNCRLVEAENSDHVIHITHSDFYIEAVNSLLSK